MVTMPAVTDSVLDGVVIDTWTRVHDRETGAQSNSLHVTAPDKP